MFQEECNAVAKAARVKVALLKDNFGGYFIASMLAGIYVGLAIFLIYSIGGMLADAPYTKTVMGISFGISLSLVIVAGAELFTGNNMVMTIGFFRKTTSFGELLWLWLVCFVGNWAGSLVVALLFLYSGLVTGSTADFIGVISSVKMNLSFSDLVIRGILCNTLVCLAVWSSYRVKSDSGKLIMIFWCLFAFITTGFEHSVANMSLLSVGLIGNLHAGVSLGGYFFNILAVSLGNMIGAVVMVALPYLAISHSRE